MNAYKIFALALCSMAAVSCKQTLFEDLDSAGASVVGNENIKYDGNIITVKKGTPVEFSLTGDPDFITFFSGELGHQYIYSQRMEGNIDDIVSSKLKFKLWADIGVARAGEDNSMRDQMDILFVTEKEDGTPVFPGLSGDFEKDSIMLEKEIPWQTLVEKADMPTALQVGNAKTYSLDMMPYLGKKFTMAFVHNKIQKEAPINSTKPEETIAQSTFHFDNMYLETEWKNGRITKQNANCFGFTPVNMKNKTVFEDHKDNVFDMPIDREYGAVENTVEGHWNFSTISAGSFYVTGCAVNFKWRYSWLVSDYLNFASTVEPDYGVKIKDINLPVTSYSHTYNTVGTYKATFLMQNRNYDDSQKKVCEFVINVVDSF